VSPCACRLTEKATQPSATMAKPTKHQIEDFFTGFSLFVLRFSPGHLMLGQNKTLIKSEHSWGHDWADIVRIAADMCKRGVAKFQTLLAGVPISLCFSFRSS
jgi:hypothetical protein